MTDSQSEARNSLIDSLAMLNNDRVLAILSDQRESKDLPCDLLQINAVVG